MRLLAALVTGAAVALAVGAAARCLPAWRLPERRHRGDLAVWLTQTGSTLTPARFVLVSVAAGAATLLLVAVGTGAPAVGLVPAATAAALPRLALGRRRGARLRELQEAWPDAIRDLLASIAAGLSLHQGLVALATRGREPLRTAFRRYPALQGVSGTIAALEVIKEELADPASDRVIEVLVLAHERGGTVVTDILRDLAEATTKDVRTVEEITTDALEQRINARAVFVLPWFVLLVLVGQGGHFRDFYRSGAGIAVILVGAALSLIGIAFVARLSRQPPEERVFGGQRSGP